MKAKGVARIYDALIACTLLAIGIASCISQMPPPIKENNAHQLSELASSYLVFLDRNGLLGKAVYSSDLPFFIGFFEDALPSSMGFAIRVFNGNWEQLSSFQSKSGFSDSGSSAYFLSGHNGTFDPRIVVLSILV